MKEQKDKLTVAIIPAYNEELNIGTVVLKTKQYVEKVIVIDDGSADETSKIARLAGAEVVVLEKNLGLSNAIGIGFKRALELNADFAITLYADNSMNPDEIPKLISQVESGNVDISVGMLGEIETGFRGFSKNALNKIYPKLLSSSTSRQKLNYKILTDSFRVDETQIQVEWLPSFKRYDEVILNKIKKLNSTNEIYNEKRKVQKTLSKLESYQLLSETFLKFIPPVILSLIISLTIIIPATNIVHLQIGYILVIMISIIITFLACWYLLIILLDKIYQNSIYLEALDRRLEQKENPQKINFEKE